MRRILSIGALLFLSAGALACTYTVKGYKWMYPAGDSIGEIRLKHVYKADGTDLGCVGAFVSLKIKAKQQTSLLWEIKNGCSAKDDYTIELTDFAPVTCRKARYMTASSASSVKLNTIFDPNVCKNTIDAYSLWGFVPANGTGYVGCQLLQGAKGCYTYKIKMNGKELADPEVEIEN